MPHSPEKIYYDILQCCDELKSFIEGKTFEDLEENRALQLLLEREFEIIGEALNRLYRVDPELFNQIRNASKIVGTRNILAHGYDTVDYRILWTAATMEVDRLKEDIKTLQAC